MYCQKVQFLFLKIESLLKIDHLDKNFTVIPNKEAHIKLKYSIDGDKKENIIYYEEHSFHLILLKQQFNL